MQPLNRRQANPLRRQKLLRLRLPRRPRRHLWLLHLRQHRLLRLLSQLRLLHRFRQLLQLRRLPLRHQLPGV